MEIHGMNLNLLRDIYPIGGTWGGTHGHARCIYQVVNQVSLYKRDRRCPLTRLPDCFDVETSEEGQGGRILPYLVCFRFGSWVS